MASDIHTGSIDVLSNEEEHKTLIESKPKRRFIINPFRGFYNAVSSSKKNINSKMNFASDAQLNASTETSQSCSTLSHAVSMPVLTCPNCLQYRQDVDKLLSNNAELKKELKLSKAALEASLKSERSLRDRLATETQKQIKLSDKFEDLTLGSNRPTAVVEQYGSLYSEIRLDTLDSLDAFPQLADLDNLKNKLLFSVIVLSFRTCQQKIQQLKEKLLADVGITRNETKPEAMSASKTLEEAVSLYLKQSVDWYNLSQLTQEIQASIYSTLYDYPCLKQCSKLKVYIEECVKVSWKLCVQCPTYYLEFDCKIYSPNKHVRFHTSNADSNAVKSCLWPTLLEAKSKTCLYKGIVLT